MKQRFLSPSQHVFLFSLLAIVYIIGLFVPLMDNDSAHHANIALHMYLTGDYVSLIDVGKDYLDKPHLHFWLCALSYQVFGTTTFAYKFPSFLFTLLGTYSTYRLGAALYDKETGKLAALIVASSFAYILANNDVRMDAILTACIAFSIWQLVDWIHTKQLIFALGGALGLALGFCTKGHIAVFTPAVALFFYLLYKREWKVVYHWQFFIIIIAFCVLIAPVVYCYYLQYDLHPEKIIRGKTHISGVQFILWGQSIERFKGEDFGSHAKNDYFFFIHSFLWAFAPWGILAFWALIKRISTFFHRNYEWVTTGTFTTLLILISLSSFKLPHYINILFPLAAVQTSSWLMERDKYGKVKSIRIIQLVLCSMLLIAGIVINTWAFPVTALWKIIAAAFIFLVIIYGITSRYFSYLQQAVVASVSTMVFTFFLLNANFYPQLLTYQAGGELAKLVNKEIGGREVYYWPQMYSSSFSYYTKTLPQAFSDSLLTNGRKTWVIAENDVLQQIRQQYRTGKEFHHLDYEITMLKWKFINPSTRKQALDAIALIEILGKKQ